jgi:hypothetical protein
MEIYYKEITRGQVNFEVSIHDTQDHEKPVTDPLHTAPPFFVFLTARDAASRTIWSTPVLSEQGTMKTYESVSEAINDAVKKFR